MRTRLGLDMGRFRLTTLRDYSSRGYSARNAVYPLNEADIPPVGRDSASLRPIGTSDAEKSICRAQEV